MAGPGHTFLGATGILVLCLVAGGVTGWVRELLDRVGSQARDLAQAHGELRGFTEERKRAEETRGQTEKLAAMGQLLAGVAHELNNLLTVILGGTDLLKTMVGSGPLRDEAEEIGQAAERCARIVRNLLALARQRPLSKELVSLNQIVREAVELLSYALRADNIEVIWNFAEDLPLVSADPHQLQQVLVNLVTNAHQAMLETSPPRRLTVTTAFDPRVERVVLEVTDTGPGIPPEILPRIFEPFFTTKLAKDGTGLGLSLCQGIIRVHDGTIGAENVSGRGARFRVELPVHVEVSPEHETRVAATSSGRKKRILVVDDEPGITKMLKTLLTADGHQVETAANGVLALEKLRDRTYDLILSDIKMPELDGPGFYREVTRHHPGIKHRIVFITGDALGPQTRAFLEETGVRYLNKPVVVEEIRRLCTIA